MATASAPPVVSASHGVHAKLSKSPGKLGMAIFVVVLVIGVVYAAGHLISDLSTVHTSSVFPFVLLGIALMVALGFEFVNGFHDTANAVATVIYTHSLDPHVAVAWSGLWNFVGVVLSTGAVAFGIISLLPVELILQVGRGAGFAMVFALLDSRHYLEPGNMVVRPAVLQLAHLDWIDHRRWYCQPVDAGPDRHQRRRLGPAALNVGKSLLLSPIVGFALAAGLLTLSKVFIRDPRLYEAPKGTEPPPFWIRTLHSHLHRRKLRPRIERWPKAWG